MSFKDYTSCILNAFCAHPKPSEVIKRKNEILVEVSKFHNLIPESVLYVGFNPAIITDITKNIFVTNISKESLDFIKSNGIAVTNINFNELEKYKKQFDVVIVLDEFFTFAKNDIDQKNLVSLISDVTKEYFITTCKDYKNQEFKDREFSNPAIIRNNENKIIYLEYHNYDLKDKNSWVTELFEIIDNRLNTHGPWDRRALFFKQLAKFSADSGAVGFTVHKNLMYKSLIKKNYEHVISVRFDNYGS